MGIAIGVFWVVGGILYLLWKFGSEEAGGGTAGGIMAICIPIAIYMGAYVMILIFKESSPLVLIVCLIAWGLWSYRKNERKTAAIEYERKKISELDALIIEYVPALTEEQLAYHNEFLYQKERGTVDFWKKHYGLYVRDKLIPDLSVGAQYVAKVTEAPETIPRIQREVEDVMKLADEMEPIARYSPSLEEIKQFMQTGFGRNSDYSKAKISIKELMARKKFQEFSGESASFHRMN